MLISGNSRKFLALEIHSAKDFFAQNDIAKKDFAENSCVEITLLKIFRGNFCESYQRKMVVTFEAFHEPKKCQRRTLQLLAPSPEASGEVVGEGGRFWMRKNEYLSILGPIISLELLSVIKTQRILAKTRRILFQNLNCKLC